MTRVFQILLLNCLLFASGLFAQNINKPPGNDGPVSIETILRTFRFPASSKSTSKELNQKLIEMIRDRRVGFLLDDKMIKELKDAGASDELLKTIDTSLTPREKQGIIDDAATVERKKAYIREMISLEDSIDELYRKKDYESRKKLIAVGKEFIKRFGNDADAEPMVQFLISAIPKWEKQIAPLH